MGNECVILSEAKDLDLPAEQILHCVQNDECSITQRLFTDCELSQLWKKRFKGTILTSQVISLRLAAVAACNTGNRRK